MARMHDRRSGEREVVATMAAGPLTRHEVDDLYGVTLIEALASEVTVLTGPARTSSPTTCTAGSHSTPAATLDSWWPISGGRLEAAPRAVSTS